MTKQRIASSFFLLSLALTLCPVQAFSQDLNKLLERSTQLWALRVKADKAKSADFVERDSRSNFPMYETLKEAAVEAIELTPDKTKMLVRVNARIFDPRIGTFQQTVVEPWVYSGGNWFLHVEWAKDNPFASKDKPSATTTAFSFSLSTAQLDLGTHTQGETITQTVQFTAPRRELQDVRVVGLAGLRLGQTQWIDDTRGMLQLVLDTSMISKDIDQEVQVEAAGQVLFDVFRSSAKLKLTGKIDGRVSITQLEQTPQAKADKFVEMELRNVSASPLRIDAIRRADPWYYAVDAKFPLEIPSGQSVKVSMRYLGTPTADGEAVLQFAPGTLPKNDLLFRIHTAEPTNAAPTQQTMTRQQLDALVKEAERQAEREADRNRILQQQQQPR